MKNIAVLQAECAGTRLGLNKPKQILKVAGETVMEHTITVFQNHPIQIMMTPPEKLLMLKSTGHFVLVTLFNINCLAVSND